MVQQKVKRFFSTESFKGSLISEGILQQNLVLVAQFLSI